MAPSKKIVKIAEKLAEAISLIESSKTEKALTILRKIHGSAEAKSAPKSPRTLTAYQQFAKEHLGQAKKDHDKGAMAAVAAMWAKAKDTYKPKKSATKSPKAKASPKSPKAKASPKPKAASKPKATPKPKAASKPKAKPASKPKAPKSPKAKSSKPKAFYEFF